MAKRKSLGRLALLIVVGGCVGGWAVSRGRARVSYTLRVAEPIRRSLSITLTENGVLESESALNIAAPNASGQRKLIELVPEGTIVKEGDVLARFDTAQLEEKLERLEHSGFHGQLTDARMDFEIRLSDLQANCETATENARLAELTVKAMEFAPKLERDAAAARFNNARNEIKRAENRIRQETNRRDIRIRQINENIAENARSIEEVKSTIEAFSIHAPAEGIVVYPRIKISGLTRKVQTGDMLYKSQIFLIIPNLFKMTAQLEVNEENIRRVRLDQAVELTLEAFHDARFSGAVVHIDRLAHVKENNEFVKVFTVAVRIHEQDLDRLRPGMNVRATLKLQEYPNALTLPIETILHEGDQFYADVEKDGRVVREPISVLDAGTDVVVIERAPAGRVLVQDSELRTFLADPDAAAHRVKWVRWQS